jgi:hypothetical protein
MIELGAHLFILVKMLGGVIQESITTDFYFWFFQLLVVNSYLECYDFFR